MRFAVSAEVWFSEWRVNLLVLALLLSTNYVINVLSRCYFEFCRKENIIRRGLQLFCFNHYWVMENTSAKTLP